jgi:hypothetical protein
VSFTAKLRLSSWEKPGPFVFRPSVYTTRLEEEAAFPVMECIQNDDDVVIEPDVLIVPPHFIGNHSVGAAVPAAESNIDMRAIEETQTCVFSVAGSPLRGYCCTKSPTGSMER